MLKPDLVAECVAAMRAVVKVPVMVKMRVGVIASKRGESFREAVQKFDEEDYEALHNMVGEFRDASVGLAA